VVALALAVLAGCGAADPPAPAPIPLTPVGSVSPRGADADGSRLAVTVKTVIDGDTLMVTGLPEGTALVRLIGINAPETGNGRTIRECFGREAARWLEGQLPRGSRVSLAYDVGARDRFGRRLAYVYGAEGAFLNAALVESGYAQTMTIPPNVRHAVELRALERRARGERRGLWGACPDAGRRR
jgi:micrococcal nuclease